MKTAHIHLQVDMDAARIPERIRWRAQEHTQDTLQDTKALSLTVWDPSEKSTMRFDIWTKDMPIEDMKKFYLDTLSGMAQSILNATGDKAFSEALLGLCHTLSDKKKPDNKP